jgi:lysozyme
MKTKWISIVCILAPAALAGVAAHAIADEETIATQVPTICAGAATLQGIDISDHQTTESWTTIHQAGNQFTFVKATEGTDFMSARFEKDWKAAKDAGVPRGSYHFFRPADDAEAQADYFLTTSGALEKGDLPPMLDLEVTDGVAADEITPRVQIWLTRVEQATNRTPIIYTGPAFWEALKDTAGFDRYPLFIADYNVTCPKVPLPWKNWSFWQHGIGTVQGVKENTDLDIFNGMLTSLQML